MALFITREQVAAEPAGDQMDAWMQRYVMPGVYVEIVGSLSRDYGTALAIMEDHAKDGIHHCVLNRYGWNCGVDDEEELDANEPDIRLAICRGLLYGRIEAEKDCETCTTEGCDNRACVDESFKPGLSDEQLAMKKCEACWAAQGVELRFELPAGVAIS